MQKRYSPTQPKHLGGKVRAKKSLGQHFLKDLSIAKQIADTVDSFVYPTETDCVDNCFKSVLEIGPGMGVLTQFLLEKEKIKPAVLCYCELISFQTCLFVFRLNEAVRLKLFFGFNYCYCTCNKSKNRDCGNCH